jgi:hypothetical protein
LGIVTIMVVLVVLCSPIASSCTHIYLTELVATPCPIGILVRLRYFLVFLFL